jgi:hypothetical protein
MAKTFAKTLDRMGKGDREDGNERRRQNNTSFIQLLQEAEKLYNKLVKEITMGITYDPAFGSNTSSSSSPVLSSSSSNGTTTKSSSAPSN